MNEQAKILLRRMAMLRALHRDEDPRKVGEGMGMNPKQVSNTLAGLAKLGLLDVRQEDPGEGAPKYIRHRNVYTLTSQAAAVMRELDRV